MKREAQEGLRATDRGRRDTLHASRFTGAEPDRWLQLAVRALARCDRTTAQIERLLAAKGAPPSQIRAAVLRLKSLLGLLKVLGCEELMPEILKE